MDTSIYDADYFLRGPESGKSLYTDYRWMPEATRPMVASMVSALGITHAHTVLDFGCSRGYVVRALREMEYRAFGVDVSDWALENADERAKLFCGYPELMLSPIKRYDWIIAKDVLEHVEDLQPTIDRIMHAATVGVFAVVPLSLMDGDPYIVAEYEKDVTHLHRLCLSSWAKMFMRPGWAVEGRYMLPWIKQNWYKDGWEWGNGFITARRA